MNLLHRPSKILITGTSGTGKSTYFTRYVLSAFRTRYDSIFVFDHQGEFSFRMQIQPAETEDDLSREFYNGFVVFDPSLLFPGQTYEAWQFFCDWTFARAKADPTKPRLLAVDELQLFSSTSEYTEEMAQVIETGRKYTLDFVGITQQLNLVHNRLRNQMTELVTFRHEDGLILDALLEKGFDVEQVRALKVGDYIARQLTTGVFHSGNIFLDSDQQVTSVASEAPDVPESAVSDNDAEGQENSTS